MADSRKIKKKDLSRLVEEWRHEFRMLIPSRDDGIATMAVWRGQEIYFPNWYRNTIVPPKTHILPNKEELFSFSKGQDGYNLELPPPREKQLLFGIRPCDASALAILDMTFKNGHKDPYYLARRQNTVLVGLVCLNPYDSCFCTSLGSGPGDASNVDLMLTDIGEEFIIAAVTEAGQGLLVSSSSLINVTQAEQEKASAVAEAARQRVTRSLDITDIDRKLGAAFDDQDFWQKVAAKCISCGICTLLCPTCYCFDISDELTKGNGARLRCSDSCSFSLYTRMPAENPRSEKWQRVRNKVCHKYQFYPTLFNTIACTGCGRCIRLCPVNWDIIQILTQVPRRQVSKRK